jgi:[acyl-carrier-protein] S-malonyltransferase
MTLAVLCSGQGPQHPQMFALTGEASEAANLFAHAATLFDGRDPRVMVRTDSNEALHQNRVGQILCTLQALAATSILRDVWPRRLIIAGYSVGELAAWNVAGLLDAAVTLDLAAQRAEVMDAASIDGDGLLFVRGLSRGAVEDLCKDHNVAVAIVNPGNACVLGGAGAALDALADEAEVIGAVRVVRLAVNVASHTPRLASASKRFREVLGQAPIKLKTSKSGTRLFSGVDGSPVIDIALGMDRLAAQISRTVQWEACLEGCVEAGATSFLELGPGRALSEMASGAYPGIPARSLEDFRTLTGIHTWLARVNC